MVSILVRVYDLLCRFIQSMIVYSDAKGGSSFRYIENGLLSLLIDERDNNQNQSQRSKKRKRNLEKKKNDTDAMAFTPSTWNICSLQKIQTFRTSYVE